MSEPGLGHRRAVGENILTHHAEYFVPRPEQVRDIMEVEEWRDEEALKFGGGHEILGRVPGYLQ